MSEVGNATRITTATTTSVLVAPGILQRIVINVAGASASTATLYDNTAGSGTVIGVLNTTTSGVQSIEYGVRCKVGLTIVTATGTPADLTVVAA